MLSGLEIIEIIKEYKNDIDEKIESSKMWGVNNSKLLTFQSQKEVLENLLEDIDIRIEQNENVDVWDKYTKGQWHR